MSCEILSLLPDEARNLYIEAEINQLDEQLAVEQRRAAIVRDMNLLLDLNDLANSVALRATRKPPSRR